jgi:hypothetical protein
MAEWLLLLLLVPAIVVPVVFLFGFAGCGFEGHGTLLAPPPIIQSADGTSVSTIRLTWMVDPSATDIKFERTKSNSPGLPGPPVIFTVPASPPMHDDPGLEAGTSYQYTARAIYASDTSDPSAPVIGTTLTLSTPAVTFDATGGGSTDSGIGNASTTWPHTASGDSRAVVVGMRWAHNSVLPNVTPTRAATYGGVSMQSLGVIGLNNTQLSSLNGTYHEFFGLLNPPAGPQTVSLSVDRPGSTSVSIEGCSVSYTQVSAFVSPASSVAGTETGTGLLQTITSAVNEMIVQMFTAASGQINGYSQRPRYTGTANNIGFVIGDAPGAPTVQFTASRADGADYAALAVRLTPVS